MTRLPPYNERELLNRVASGDEGAFSVLFNRYKDKVFSIAWTYTENQFYSEEAVQDVFLQVWKNRSRLTEIENFESWIFIIARNQSVNTLHRMLRSEKKLGEYSEWVPVSSNETESTVSVQELQKLLNEAMSSLSPQQRKVFELCRVQGVKRQEVAEMLSLSPATVSAHLTIAIRIVRAFVLSRILLLFLFFSPFR